MIHFRRVLIVLLNKASCVFPDRFYLWMQFYLRMGYSFNLDNPRTLSEKIQWLKLNYKNPLYPSLVDKYLVKDIVAGIIGKDHIIPTIGVWDNPESIEWDKLPEQFVLKTTHGGGNSGVVICKDKSLIDKQQVIDKLKKSLKQDIYKTFREWPYKNVNKRIIAEKYMEQEDGSPLIDYKFFCFNGEPKYVYLSQYSHGNDKDISCFLDLTWSQAPFQRKGEKIASVIPTKPELFSEMTEMAKFLSKEFPFVRVDLYEINNKVFFSELTFYPSSGMQPYEPIEWDKKLGDLLVLPEPLNYNQYD
ncbi:ATP-grasp fold amidoligase family protein [Prevotellamassilia timonensis]|uniref:ATP-grasp fold amidoligase family protein n=1 Tax=Prevotellamassilia timonensis TaxID=1852370 RepID=UPI001F3507F7|nr:ATP-grasp fold amidoligase family protein [Prevotellamassilia timonensis]MCF2634089.1 glycosyl transferase [Prevotellamassilia timonensis]